MARHRTPAPSPVQHVHTPHGPELVLRNPEITPRQWRRLHLRAGLRPSPVLAGLATAALAGLAAALSSGAAALGAAGLAGLSLIGTVEACGQRASQALTAHLHHPSRACAFNRGPGRYCLSATTITDHEPTRARVRALIAGLDELHHSPAGAWLDSAVPARLHQVVWLTLLALHRAQPARALADDLADKCDVVDLVARTRQAVNRVDDATEQVLRQLQGALLLTREWERKLQRTVLVARTERTLTAMPDHGQLQVLAGDADTVLHTVFGSITAARDLTDAGPFPWENPPATWSVHGLRPNIDDDTTDRS